MRGSKIAGRWLRCALLATSVLTAVGMTGCQVDVGGQTLPSPYYMTDDVQYFAPGPSMKVAREAAAMKERAGEQQLRR